MAPRHITSADKLTSAGPTPGPQCEPRAARLVARDSGAVVGGLPQKIRQAAPRRGVPAADLPSAMDEHETGHGSATPEDRGYGAQPVRSSSITTPVPPCTRDACKPLPEARCRAASERRRPERPGHAPAAPARSTAAPRCGPPRLARATGRPCCCTRPPVRERGPHALAMQSFSGAETHACSATQTLGGKLPCSPVHMYVVYTCPHRIQVDLHVSTCLAGMQGGGAGRGGVQQRDTGALKPTTNRPQWGCLQQQPGRTCAAPGVDMPG